MSTLVLLNGDEDFLIERAIRDECALSLVGSPSEFSLPKQLEAYLYASQLPLLVASGGRVFVLWDVIEIPSLPVSDGDTLICVAKNSKKPLIDKRAKRTQSLNKLKSYADNNDVLRWILKEGEQFNIDLSRVANALFMNCGNSLRKISSEIEKISILSSKGAVVAPEDVRGLMCFSADLTPQPITEAICEGNSIKALVFYDKLQELNDETGWIIAYLQRHVIQYLKFGILVEKQTPDSEIAEALGLHPFIYRKTLQNRRGLWTKQSLVRSINTLCELDIAHKKGELSARFGLELEITRLAEESKKNVRD